MNYAKAQKDVLAKLVKNSKAVINCITGGATACLIVDGVAGYIFPEDANWLDVEKIEATTNISALRLPLCVSDEILTPTENLIDKGGYLAREYKKERYNGSVESVYIQEQFVKNFDAPTFYQALDKPRSIIAIRETTQLEGERLVGFVMPFHLKED